MTQQQWGGNMPPWERKIRIIGAVTVCIIFAPIVIQVVTKSNLVHFFYWPVVGAAALGIGFVYFQKWKNEQLGGNSKETKKETPRPHHGRL